ncbi:diaminobutyrate acetyltransferase [Oceanobacillus piezotolerans]|uniref:L-2,4-diaminobutyric acid acetyltransferase n=1 Tax=Oceanobacillus piezotolerans TaxID=2448030 RepID=A0A498DCN6_9BACI|nr:diaminobutyrate acetyltransferase [Oceanobacillus piezotolerans]RLL45513.1 diaminobutyrate acetyltransferase [Oceanobacillus piezotolerans]
MSKLKITSKEYHFRKPKKEDGAEVWELVKHTGNLDLNSSYSYLMWCEIFSDTSIVVVRKETQKVVGFISGFIHPEQQDTIFIWQVAVHASERGRGLATKMLLQLLERDYCVDVHYVEATVGPSNTPSKRLFLGLARKFQTNWKISDYFKADDFPSKGHEDELLFKIGPIEK